MQIAWPHSFFSVCTALFLQGCSTTETASDNPDKLQLSSSSEALSLQGKDEIGGGDPAKPAAAGSHLRPRKLQGFDFAGSTFCWSLAVGSDCIDRPDPILAACTLAGGEILYCEDCTRLCTKALEQVGQDDK